MSVRNLTSILVLLVSLNSAAPQRPVIDTWDKLPANARPVLLPNVLRGRLLVGASRVHSHDQLIHNLVQVYRYSWPGDIEVFVKALAKEWNVSPEKVDQGWIVEKLYPRGPVARMGVFVCVGRWIKDSKSVHGAISVGTVGSTRVSLNEELRPKR